MSRAICEALKAYFLAVRYREDDHAERFGIADTAIDIMVKRQEWVPDQEVPSALTRGAGDTES